MKKFTYSNFKTIPVFPFAYVFVLFFTFFGACDKKPDDDKLFPCVNKYCGTYGDCDSGNCNCEDGAALDPDGRCNVLFRDAFVGKYDVNPSVNCANTNGSLGSGEMEISAGVDHIKSVTVNILNGDIICPGTISGTTISIQETLYNGRKYTGSGTISGTQISLNLNEKDENIGTTCQISIVAQKK